MRTYLEERREVVLAEGIDADRPRREAAESDHGTRLLRCFGQLARD